MSLLTSDTSFCLYLHSFIHSFIHSGITVLGPRNTTVKERHLPAFMELTAWGRVSQSGVPLDSLEHSEKCQCQGPTLRVSCFVDLDGAKYWQQFLKLSRSFQCAGRVGNTNLKRDLNQGDCAPQDIWQRLEIFLVVRTLRVLLASRV